MKEDKFKSPLYQKYRYLLPYLKKGRTIDLGSQHRSIKEIGIKAVGIDIVKGKNVDVIWDLNRGLPFPDNYADNLVASNIIEHLINPYEFLKECYRILKPKGRLFIITPNAFGIPYLLESEKSFIKTYGHLYAWSLEMLAKLMEKAGFKIYLKSKIPVRYGTNIFLKILCYLFYKYRPLLFVVGEKQKA